MSLLRIFILSTVLFLCLQYKTYAQKDTLVTSSCSQKLKEMVKNYEQGYLTDILSALSECINSGFTTNEKLQAYRLIILTFLFLDEQEKAKSMMYTLLKSEPDYKPNKALDPIEFINLYNSYSVLPYLNLGVSGGTNLTSPSILQSYSVANSEKQPTVYTPGLSFNFGLVSDILVVNGLFVTVEGQYQSRIFSSSTQVLNSSINQSLESQTAVAVPLGVKYVFGKAKIKPYIRAGFATEFLIGANNEIKRVNSQNTNQTEFAGAPVDVLKQRSRLNLSVLAGLGVTYKVGYGYLFLDIRGLYGLSNLAIPGKRYNFFKEQISNYGYIENDFKLNQLQLNVGYSRSLYKVKSKLKTYTAND
jgi:hypothetical protein